MSSTSHKISGNNEWYTPAKYVESARTVLGKIDVDPASNRTAQKTVRARRYYSAENSGLVEGARWAGNVWLNPPYSATLIKAFIAKLTASYEAGVTKQAIVLVNASTDTAWFRVAAGSASAVCFTFGRIKFERPDGSVGGSPAHGQAFFYFGDNVEAFRKEFTQYGLVYEN